MTFENARLLLAALLVFGLGISVCGSFAKESGKVPASGRGLYMANCEACHLQGQNVIKPEKEIVTSTKVKSLALFEEFLQSKHGAMPAFKDIAANADSLRKLYKYTKGLKQQSWDYQIKEEEKKDNAESAP